MKNLTSKLNLFVSLFFLTALSPLLLKSGDANAAPGCVLAPGAVGTCGAPSGTTCADPTGVGATGKCSYVADLADDNAFTRTICNALRIITGTGGKAFAAFAIISLGIGFFTGKVSWGLMVGVTAGIAAMFGAPTIVAAISGTSASQCSTSSVM